MGIITVTKPYFFLVVFIVAFSIHLTLSHTRTDTQTKKKSAEAVDEKRKRKLTKDEEAEVSRIFSVFDIDSSGVITCDELVSILNKSNADEDDRRSVFSEEDLRKIFNEHDVDNNGFLDPAEFRELIKELFL